MPHLFASGEWQLLRKLGNLLGLIKARYEMYNTRSQCESYESGNPNAELLEIELRRLFMTREHPLDLEIKDYENCQAKLLYLCPLLDGLVPFNIVEESQYEPNPTYPRLRALEKSLKNTTGPIDLVHGPNPAVFSLPNDDSELAECLNKVTEANDQFDLVLQPSARWRTVPPFDPQPRRTTWENSRVRDQATLILTRVFERFRCAESHKVLLRLIEDQDESVLLPDMQLMLSSCLELSCSEPQSWHEARCCSDDLTEFFMPLIRDICTNIKEDPGQGKSLILLVKGSGLLGDWVDTASSLARWSGQSLEQLITHGAFKRIGLDILSHNPPPTRFDHKDKRSLAVKLGFCLMNFFDVDITTDMIYFRYKSTLKPTIESPYLAFKPRLPATANAYSKFELGHPALLSFAKLLLEIEFGDSIHLTISHKSSENESTWTSLFKFIDYLEENGRSDTYIDAVRSCLLVYRSISRELHSTGAQKTTAVSIIREKLYNEVVCKLEKELEATGTKSNRKRRRSNSLSPEDNWNTRHGCDESTTLPSNFTNRPASRFKRQRFMGLQQQENHEVASSGALRIATPRQERISHTSGNWNRYSSHRVRNSVRSSTWQSDHLDNSGSYDTLCQQAPRQEEFEIAIICALPLEYDAISYLLEECWDESGHTYGKAPGDPNYYTTGRIGSSNVVIHLLTGMGKINAAGAAASMRSSFNNLRLALVVGVCGATPTHQGKEILLGDVIISSTIVQYDFGRQYTNRFIHKKTVNDSLGRANKEIRNLLMPFRTRRGAKHLKQRTTSILQDLQRIVNCTEYRGLYDYPGTENDKLFKASCLHKHNSSNQCMCQDCEGDLHNVCERAMQSTCTQLGCNESYLIPRSRHREIQKLSKHAGTGRGEDPQLALFIGDVGSADRVCKSAVHRDAVAKETGVIAFEMEGAGIWDEIPSIVVKGVSDYADSHKNSHWQNFSAATAASACKAIIERYPRRNNAR